MHVCVCVCVCVSSHALSPTAPAACKLEKVGDLSFFQQQDAIVSRVFQEKEQTIINPIYPWPVVRIVHLYLWGVFVRGFKSHGSSNFQFFPAFFSLVINYS